MKHLSWSRPHLVDFHCHLDLFPNHEELIKECDREKIATLTVTTTPKAWARNKLLADRSRYVRVGLGLHPQLVRERANEIQLFEHLLDETKYVGEVGLDASPQFYSSFAEQERIFRRVLNVCAESGGKILTVHSVRAVPRVLRHLDANFPASRGRVVLHWFTGNASDAKRAAAFGCYFSVNGAMLRSPKQRALVKKFPLERILTETDGPFVKQEGSVVRPKDVANTVTELADLFQVDEVEMSNQIVTNLASLLRNDKQMHMRNSFVPTYKIPKECSKNELLEFRQLVLLAGKVNKHTLLEGVDRAKYLAFVRNGRDKLVGVAALKTPLAGYRDGVFAKARSDLRPSDFPLEIGYIHVLKEANGHRLSRRMMEALLERSHGRGVFLTTEVSNVAIIKFAMELGFTQSGDPYRSVEENDNLVLFTRQ